VASCFLILGIVGLLHGKPFNKKTLKKPKFVFAFFFSLILVSINLGQIISIIIPLLNSNASPNQDVINGQMERCGHGSEIVALSLMAWYQFKIRLYKILKILICKL